MLLLSVIANRLIDFEEAFEYPLYNAPICLAHPDGLMRKTQKSKLAEIIISGNNSIRNEEVINKHMSAYVPDMMAQIKGRNFSESMILRNVTVGTVRESLFSGKFLTSFFLEGGK